MYLDEKEITGIYLGDTEISSAYVGDKEVFNLSPYTPDQVLFEKATAGTYSVDILADGKYEVYCIGGGAGGAANAYKWKVGKSTIYEVYIGSGGSGSGFIGILKIPANTYSIIVGGGGSKAASTSRGSTVTGGAGGNSQITGIITSYGAGSHTNHQAGPRGSAPSILVDIISQTLNSQGNNGSNYGGDTAANRTVAGGASKYNGYGAGGSAYGKAVSSGVGSSASKGAPGYVKIVYKGR